MRKFKQTITSRATIKKKKLYEFPEFTEEELEEGMKYTYRNPLLMF